MSYLVKEHNLSVRRACRIVGMSRSTYHRQPVKTTPEDPDKALRGMLRDYALKHPCHGFKRAHAWLVHDQGWQINRKKVQRLWREEGLTLKQVRRRRREGTTTTDLPVRACKRNHVWSVDFQFHVTEDGRPFKIVSMIDEYTRESLLDVVERKVNASQLCGALTRVFQQRGVPEVLRMDNGPEFVSAALRRLCQDRVGMAFIPPGQPWNNGFVESFNRRRRYECLERHSFGSLLEAQVLIADFHREHNQQHRHSSLGYMTPDEFASSCSEKTS